MKNIFISMLSMACYLSSPAQITVTSTTLPALGDTLRYQWAYNQATNDMVTPPGFDLSWDFTGVTPGVAYDEIYRPPGEGQFAARFPTAHMVVIDPSGERYYQVNSAGLYLLGHTEKELFGFPFNVVYKNLGTFRERITPLNFFDIYVESTVNFEFFRFVDLPAGLQDAYKAAGLTTMDSIRLTVSYQHVMAVNATGIATVPGPLPQPQYPVLRQNSTIYRTSLLEGRVAPLGWVNITDLTMKNIPSSRDKLEWDTSGLQIFFNNVTKAEIARITIDAKGNPVHVRYKNNLPAACAAIDGQTQNIWTGTAGNNWENAANWSCGKVPGTDTDVVVNSGTVVINSAVVIRSLKVNPGAQVTVGSGSLTVLH
jgi:hypothetical protein